MGIDARVAGRGLRDEARDGVPAGGEPDDPHARGRRLWTGVRLRAQQAHGSLDVMDRRIGARRPAVRGQAITQHRARKAALREPLRRFESLLVDDHALVAAARHDEQGDAIGDGTRPEEGQRRPGDVLGIAVAQGACGARSTKATRAVTRSPPGAPCGQSTTVSPAGSVVVTAAGASGACVVSIRASMTREKCGAASMRQYDSGRKKKDRPCGLSFICLPELIS